MSDTRRIAIVGGTPAALRKARAAGFEVVWIHHPRELAVEGLAEVSEALLTDYREPAAVAELLAAVHASRPLERVVSMIEDGLETAATATTALGLPGTGPRSSRSSRTSWSSAPCCGPAGWTVPPPVSATPRTTCGSSSRRTVPR